MSADQSIYRITEVAITLPRCHMCGKPLKRVKKPRLYCDERCKQAAYRIRKRFEVDPALLKREVEERHRQWTERGYTDAVFEQLMDLWMEHGGEALYKAEKLLQLYAVYRGEQEDKRNKP